MNIANRLTIFRTLLVPFYFIFLLYSFPNNQFFVILSFILLLIIAIGDAIDGYLARKLNQVSKLGTFMDPVADKLTISISFIILGVYMEIPAWLVIIVISKDVLIAIGWFLVYLQGGDITIRPSIFGKMCAFMQFVVIVLHFVFKVITSLVGIQPYIWWITCLLTVIAAAFYVFDGIKRLNGDKNGSKS
jgi:CDP-diacylglycerol--glycerol-3-phosphate 3-phosphatidyltransferase